MNELTQFTNCRLLRDHKIVKDDLWVRNGKIIDPEKVFFDEKRFANNTIDCNGGLIAPGFIDLQINGGFGIDFANNIENIEESVQMVAKKILAHGVTSFCPTMVTSPVSTYHTVVPKIKKQKGGKHGATILGLHLEGPFINSQKKGAHPEEFIQNFTNGTATLLSTYGSLENVAIITMAPEKPNALSVIEDLAAQNITVALGHSMANLSEGEAAIKSGSNLITHLFNAMLPFHHRDPGLVGLLTSQEIPKDRTVFFGIISDGAHTHPSALRIAYRANPNGLILVTDAISALGYSEGEHYIGQLKVEIQGRNCYVAGTETLCGSIAALSECVKILHKSTGCSIVYALEAASLHPAQCLNIDKQKGTLDFNADADFIILGDDLSVWSTWIAGECVFETKQN